MLSYRSHRTSRVQARPSDIEALRLLAETKFAAQDFSGAAYEYRRAIRVSAVADALAFAEGPVCCSRVRLLTELCGQYRFANAGCFHSFGSLEKTSL